MKRIIYSFVFVFIILTFFSGCQTGTDELTGVWNNKNGQSFIFKKDHNVLWLYDNKYGVDTFKIKYRFNPNTFPAEIDLYGFDKGPLAGKELYGIIEFNAKSSFKCDFEAGNDPSLRPEDFNPDDTQMFYRAM